MTALYQSRRAQTITLPYHNSMLHRKCVCVDMGVFLTNDVIQIERVWNEISGTFKFELYSYKNKLIFLSIEFFKKANESTINSPLRQGGTSVVFC